MATSGNASLAEFLTSPGDELRARSERKERGLLEQIRQLKASLKVAHAEVEEAERRLDFACSIQEPTTSATIPTPKRKANEAAAWLVGSDWHVGETVDPAAINGKNKYTPEIARQSIERFFSNGARLIELGRSGVKIETVVLALLGDLITGYIHDELVESNSLSPTEEALLVIELVSGGIEYLLDKTKCKRLVVPCVFGNHGRTTQKRRVSTGAKNSYEWFAYQVLAQRFAGEKRVQFEIADGPHLYVECLGHTVRLHHGDDVRYQGGVGGLHIPLRKAIDSWDRFRDADLTVIGHWHQLLFGDDYVVNGSTIGYGPYALSVKARFEPPRQGFFLLDRDHGVTLRAPIRIR